MKPAPGILSPSAQAGYHLDCAWRHVRQAGAAAWRSDWWGFYVPLLVLILAALLLGGCVHSANGVRWSPLVPTTWPIFSGESKVTDSKQAEERLGKQEAKINGLQDETMHAAHLEFLKGWSVLGMMPVSLHRDLAWRFTSNGLSLLDQADPLTAKERDSARAVVANFTSGDPARGIAAEKAQHQAEEANAKLSERLASAEAKAAKLGAFARKANAKLADVAAENITLANRVRIFRWAIGTLIVLVVLLGALALYARLALGGVGAALHEAGAPAAVVSAIDGQLSKLGQWAIRTGRRAAARLEAATKVDSSTSTTTTGTTPVG